MKKQFVTYDIAKALKEKGFNEPCMAWFNGNSDEMLEPVNQNYFDSLETFNTTANSDLNPLSAPLWQQAILWLAKEHKIFVELPKTRWDNTGHIIQIKQYNKRSTLCAAAKYFCADTYEEARKLGVQEAIIVIHKRKK